jgi:hypothetical protein
MPDESILRAKAREVVRTGKMPSRRPDRILGGPGIGGVNVMARPRPEKKREPRAAADTKILPMELQVGDRRTDGTSDWEVLLGTQPSVAGWHRRQEEASPWRREYRHPNGQARSSMSCSSPESNRISRV